MTTKSGLGSAFLIGKTGAAYDISGDVSALSTMRLANSPLDVSPINVSGTKRIYGRKSGEMTASIFFNDAAAQEHVALKGLTRSDVQPMWAQAFSAIGDKGLAMLAKQVNYDWALGADGGLLASVQWLSNAAPIEPGEMLTAGLRTDTTATNGTSLDYGAVSTAFGLSAYLWITAFSGTNITISLEDSANNSAFSAITGGAFTQATGIGAQRIQTAVNGTVRRYVRVVSAGTFTSCTFAVLFVRHLVTPPLWVS